MSKIHPTAIVSDKAELADDVEVGPYAIIESDVRIGRGCRIAAHAIIRQYTQMGSDNVVDSFTVLGSLPQDYKFSSQTVSYLKIGDGNVFREGVTISRATGDGAETLVGNRTYWMMTAHAGHNVVVEDEAILVNASALAGHSRLGCGSILSGHVGVHQFCWVAQGVMTQGMSAISQHIPPYVMTGLGLNRVVGLNSVGMRRNKALTDEDRRQIREAFHITYRRGLPLSRALDEMDKCASWGAAAGQFRDFVRKVLTAPKPYNRGLAGMDVKEE